MRTTGHARRQAPAHVRAGARPEHRDDQPDPDNYTRAAITTWRVGQRYAQPFDGGEIVGVDDAGYLIGSSPSWDLAGWQPTLTSRS